MNKFMSCVVLVCLMLISASATSAPKYPEAVIPDAVEVREVTIWSDGRALDGDLYRPRNLKETDKVPAIVTSHGWGGDKKTAARYAAKFADAGFITLTFTHSSWGNSQGNALIKKPTAVDMASLDKADIHIVRKLIDPIDWVQNFRSAVDYLEGEPNVDVARIGGWGTSFGSGVAAASAANDDRVKSLVLQVAALPTLSAPQRQHAKNRAIAIARGEIMAIPENADAFPGLEGTPHFARFLQYAPMAAMEVLQTPTLFVSAGAEDLFKNEEHSEKAFEILKAKGNVKTAFHLIPEINHYGIYFKGYERGSTLALSWFEDTLK